MKGGLGGDECEVRVAQKLNNAPGAASTHEKMDALVIFLHGVE